MEKRVTGFKLLSVDKSKDRNRNRLGKAVVAFMQNDTSTTNSIVNIFKSKTKPGQIAITLTQRLESKLFIELLGEIARKGLFYCPHCKKSL